MPFFGKIPVVTLFVKGAEAVHVYSRDICASVTNQYNLALATTGFLLCKRGLCRHVVSVCRVCVSCQNN